MRKNIIVIGKIPESIIIQYNLSSYRGKNIIMYNDRYQYIEKHKHEFISDESFDNSVNAIPAIIQSPDYVFIDTNKKGIEFYKKIDEHTCVAVRMGATLKVKSMYPVTETKINNRKKKIP
jgi:hypothetical protein